MTRLDTVRRVIRGEGIPSAFRRTSERIGEALHDTTSLVRGIWSRAPGFPILNVAAAGASPRLGGLQAQLMARLAVEEKQRDVALLRPGILELSAPLRHARRVSREIEIGIRESLAITGARAVHFEGTSGLPLRLVLDLIESGCRVILGIHDFSLFCRRPHLLEEPVKRFCFYSEDLERCQRCLQQTGDGSAHEQVELRNQARQVLSAAHGLIFPSHFLLERHRTLFSLPDLAGQVIEPGGFSSPVRSKSERRRAIAYAGSAKHHKGIHLLPRLARLAGTVELHVFGGGDEDLLLDVRRIPNARVHGYYRAGSLPSLLAKYGVGLVVVPSIWPEAYCLVLSEAWSAGAVVAAFDLGAQGDRIRRDGGGWLAPLESGAEGLAGIVARWAAGEITATVPAKVASPMDAATAHLDIYRDWELM